MEHIFRIFDFNVYNDKSTDESSSGDENTAPVFKDISKFAIQIFGLNEKGETCSIVAEEYKPFFYVMVNDTWNNNIKHSFVEHIKTKIGKYYQESVSGAVFVKRRKLYGFDGGKEHKFIRLEFTSLPAFNKVKNLWYTDYQHGHTLLPNGYEYYETNIKLYEANIPPLLRFFHIRDISPSGWIAMPKKNTFEYKG